VTLLYSNENGGQPGTHVFAVGVGSHPHLLGGTKKLANKPLGLKQLSSPPVSTKALIDWFFAPILAPGSIGFSNVLAPLSTVEALVSDLAPLAVETPTGAKQLDPATRDNIQIAFESWLGRLSSNPDNIGVFYFCGHGLMVSEHFLVAEDFGRSNAQPWSQAFDISTTIKAVEREAAGTFYFFIDACREIARDVATTLGANPNALQAVDLNKKVIRKSVTTIYATGEGELAFAPQGGNVSRFTSALLSAMSGYAGIKAPGTSTWNVDGECIAAAVRQLLEYDALEASGTAGTGKQVSEQSLQGSSIPLLRLTAAPKVKVWLDLTPAQRRALYEIYLVSAKGSRFAQTQLDRIFKIDVPRGFYEVGANDPAGALPPVVHPEEELVPPMYRLNLHSQP
jgi:hypothetical protein